MLSELMRIESEKIRDPLCTQYTPQHTAPAARFRLSTYILAWCYSRLKEQQQQHSRSLSLPLVSFTVWYIIKTTASCLLNMICYIYSSFKPFISAALCLIRLTLNSCLNYYNKAFVFRPRLAHYCMIFRLGYYKTVFKLCVYIIMSRTSHTYT